MTPFEEQLKQAMARKCPPPDFTDRVLAALEPGMQSSTAGWRSWRWRIPKWSLALIAASLVMFCGGAILQQRQRVLQGEAAKDKLLLAMRIAGSKLHEARHQVLEIEAPEAQQ